MSDEETIRDAFENPSVDDPVLLPDEVGYTVRSVEVNRGSCRVLIDENITSEQATELLKDTFGEGVFGINTGRDSVPGTSDPVSTVSFRLRSS